MNQNFPKVSYCIAVYNEEKIIQSSLKHLKKSLTNILGNKNFEIIVVDNGSTDNTIFFLERIKEKEIRVYFESQKAHGLALREAIKRARFNHVVLTAIDLPFGFNDLKTALPLWKKYDIIFGSKAHSDSKINTSFKRKFASKVFRSILKLMFDVSIKDPQGSIFLKKNEILKILSYCDSNNAFFTSQLAIYGKENDLKMIEIPVVIKRSKRNSRYSILGDGVKMLSSVVREYLILKRRQSGNSYIKDVN